MVANLDHAARGGELFEAGLGNVTEWNKAKYKRLEQIRMKRLLTESSVWTKTLGASLRII